jgi:type IX secretion system PorP/SprF family membrane protein
MKLRIATFILLTWNLSTVFSQQEPQFTQFFDNKLFVNPAYAGSREVLNVTGIHREQWMGFNGRPVSSTLSIHSPLKYESVGVGMTFVHDQAGPISQTMVYGDFSYTLKFKNESRKLSFGLKGGVNVISANTSNLETTQENDPKLLQNVLNQVNPNFGVGIYYHAPHFFAGASTPKILEQSYGTSISGLEKRHYFGIIGGVVDLNNQWKLRPSSQVKITSGAPVSIDLSTAFIYRDKVWFGGMYRWDAAFGIFSQFMLSDQFKVGIAGDIGTQVIRKYNYGTIEVLLSYDFRFNKKGIRSPRYF